MNKLFTTMVLLVVSASVGCSKRSDSASSTSSSSSSGSGGSSGGGGSSAPTADTVTIDAGASSTSALAVSVGFTITGTATAVCIRNDSTVASCVWDADVTSPNAHNISSGAGTKTVYVWARDASLNVSAVTSDTIVLGCPTNFARVPASATYGTSEFCIAQYEMKAVDGSNAVESTGGGESASPGLSTVTYSAASRPDGRPWVWRNRAEMISECAASGWTLMTNDHHMAAARDLEQVASNWSGGVVGTGGIFRGHSDGTGVDPVTTSASLAVTDTTNVYIGTGNNAGQAWGSGLEQRRRLTFSTGDTIGILAETFGAYIY